MVVLDVAVLFALRAETLVAEFEPEVGLEVEAMSLTAVAVDLIVFVPLGEILLVPAAGDVINCRDLLEAACFTSS